MGQRCSFRRARCTHARSVCGSKSVQLPKAVVRPCVRPRAVCVCVCCQQSVAAGGSCPAIDRRPPPVTSAAPIGARRRPPRHWPRRGAQRRAPPVWVCTPATPTSPKLNLVLTLACLHPPDVARLSQPHADFLLISLEWARRTVGWRCPNGNWRFSEKNCCSFNQECFIIAY